MTNQMTIINQYIYLQTSPYPNSISMSTTKTYLIHQKYQNATILVKEHSDNNKNYHKIATLQPYLSDIQKKNKQKPKLTRHNKNKPNQSSSRSFRIKDISTSSLHKLNFDKIDIKTNKLERNKQTINTTGLLTNPHKIKINNDHLNRQKKVKSQQSRPFQSSLSKTIGTRQIINPPKQSNPIIQKESPQKNNAFNDYFLRMNKNKDGKQKFRKNLYEIMLPKKHSVQQDAKLESSIKKISSTEANIDRGFRKQSSHEEVDLKNGKKTELLRRNNFRRGKYELALHSSVNEKPDSQSTEPLQSQRLYQLNKKESNLSINQQMDIIAQNEMQQFYRQVRTREIQKSLEKSTQKYFGTDTYRPVKSKNQIELYVSSMINPSLHKVSQSTYDKSDNRNKSPLDLSNRVDFYAYNFDFEPEKHSISQRICEMENPLEEEESCSNLNDKEFERQRKQAQIQYFHKDHAHLEWSDDECQVDDI